MSTTTEKSSDSTSNALNYSHPDYQNYLTRWQQMIDTSEDEYTVKEAGELYLPKTEGQKSDNNQGNKAYDAYKMRAVYYSFLSDTQQKMLGLLNKEKAVVSVPSRLDDYIMEATPSGESLEDLIININHRQLVTSRCGLLLDAPEQAEGIAYPRSVLYQEKRILNWDSINNKPRWIVLDESQYENNNLEWDYVNRYLILALDESDTFYMMKTKELGEITIVDNNVISKEDDRIYPEINGVRFTGEIPFTFVNATNITPCVESPILMSLSDVCLALYRGDADYRQALFYQAIATLFLKGFEKDTKVEVGAQSALCTQNEEADAKFVQVDSTGLDAMESSIENLKSTAAQKGLDIIDKGTSESGSAINARIYMKSASLTSISQTTQEAITQQLVWAARWTGASEDDVSIQTNKDFKESTATPKDIIDLWAVVSQGGFTLEDFHKYLADNDHTEKSFDDWLEMINQTGRVNFGI